MKITTRQIIFGTIIGVLFVILLFYFTDKGIEYNQRACDYVLPSEYKLYQDTFTKEYTIGIPLIKLDLVFYTNTTGAIPFSDYKEDTIHFINYINEDKGWLIKTDHIQCDRFSDSCLAKGMIKDYMESIYINRFKKIE